MKNPIKTFWNVISIVALAGLLISNRVLQKENKSLEERLQTQYSIEQKVEFSAYGDRITGWTDPQKQRIYFGVDFKGDGFSEIYYIENPFDKSKSELVYYSTERKNRE